jgi:hypothetical protein
MTNPVTCDGEITQQQQQQQLPLRSQQSESETGATMRLKEDVRTVRRSATNSGSHQKKFWLYSWCKKDVARVSGVDIHPPTIESRHNQSKRRYMSGMPTGQIANKTMPTP